MPTDTEFKLDQPGQTLLLKSRTRGGARPGAGRPRKDLRAKADEMADLFGEGPEQPEQPGASNPASRRDLALARKEEALAGLHELSLRVKSGEYLPRAAYREATATLLSTISQALRSLPDALERRHSLPPAALQEIEATVDQVLNEAADALALFTEGNG